MDLSDSTSTLIVVWIATLVLAVFRSRYVSEPHSRLLSNLSWWISNACWLSIGAIVFQAYNRNLLSLPAVILILAASYATLAGANWFIEKRYIRSKWLRKRT